MKTKRRNLYSVTAILSLLLFGMQSVSAASSVTDAIESTTGGTYNMTANETISGPGALTLGSSNLTINAESHSITANNSSNGININAGSTLTLNSINSFSDFRASAGKGVLDNSGTLNISNSTISDNTGIAIRNNGTSTISSTGFTGNGTAISNAAGKTLTLSLISFTGNGRAIENSGTLNLSAVTVNAGNGGNANDVYQASTGVMNLSGINTFTSKISGSGAINNSGTLNLSANNSEYKGTYTQTAGTTNVKNGFFGGTSEIQAGTLNWEAINDLVSDSVLKVLGNSILNVGNGTIPSTLTLSNGGIIEDTVTVTVNNKAALKVNGANVILNSGDTINGTVALQAGNLTIDGITTAGTINAIGGTFKNTNTTTLNGNTTIAKNVAATINGTLNINNADSNVTLNGGSTGADSLNGTLALQNGNLILDGFTTAGTINATGGNVAINNSTILNGVTTIANAVKTTVNGTLNINNDNSNVVIDSATGDSIENSATVALKKGSLTLDNIATSGTINAETGNLSLSGTNSLSGITTIAKEVSASIDDVTISNARSNITLNGGSTGADTLNGTLALQNGTLTLDGISTSGNINATGGSVAVKDTTTLSGETTIQKAVSTSVSGTLNINNANSKVVLNGGSIGADTLTGKVALQAGNLTLEELTTSGNIDAAGGNLAIDGNTNLSGVTTIAKDVNTSINGVLNLDNSSSNVTLNYDSELNKDIWTGVIKLAAGTLNVDGLTSNGDIQATGGSINIQSGNLTLDGTSYIGDANGKGAEVDIAADGALIVSKDSVINKAITGNGKLLVDNSKLTINSDASVVGTLSFESKNNSTVQINADNATVNNIVKIVNNGTNSGLTLDINHNTISETVNVDGTNIKQLNLAGGEYSGNITNNGTVNNTGELLLSGQMSGSGIFNNSANLNVMKDQSGFTGTYNQSSGDLVVSSAGKLFAGDKNINGGTVSVTTTDAIQDAYKKVHLGSGTTLTHNSSEGIVNTVNKEVVNFVDNATGANIVLNNGNYLIEEALGNGKSNTITINNSANVTLGVTNYQDGTNYKLENSHLNLVENVDVQTKDYVFDKLTANNSTLSFNVKIVDGATPGSKVLETDTVTINNGSTAFNFGNIYITGEENGNPGVYNTVKNVLTNATFADNPNPDNITYVTGATTSWIYDVRTTADKHSLSMQITNYADENTLYNMNNTEGVRFFQFSDDGTDKTDVYHIGESLGETKGPKGDETAIFNVSGHNRDKNIISGKIVDEDGNETGANGSFFNIADGTKIELNIKDLTIQDADKTGEGSVVYNNSTDGKISLSNVGIKNNGGNSAIYNKGELTVSNNSLFEENKGVVVNNIGEAVISDSEFKNNTGASVIENSNADSVLTVSNSKFNGNTGVVVKNIGEATISDSEFKNNTGASVIENSNADSVLTVSNSKFEGNSGVVVKNIGKATISGSEFLNNGTAIENSKNMTITGTTLTGNNRAINNLAGELTLSGVTVSAGTNSAKNDINNEVKITLSDTNNLYSDISGSESAEITNKGVVNLSGNNQDYAGKYTQSDANTTTNVLGGKFFGGTSEITNGTLNWLTGNDIVEDAILNVSGADTTLNVGDAAHNTVLSINNGSSIDGSVQVAIAQNSALNVSGGNVALNANDNWTGNATVNVTDGVLDIDGRDGNGKFVATGGKVNLNTGNLYVTSGSQIAGTDAASGTNPAVNIKDNTKLLITGGNVTIDNNDTWDGLINLQAGVLNIDDRTSNKGILHADAGDLHFKTGTLTIENGSYIDLDVKVDLPENSIIDILKGGTVAINDNDAWLGEITLNGGVLNYGTTQSGTLTANTGDMNLLSGSILNIQIPSQVADEVNVDIRKNALVNIRDNAKFNLDSQDKWNGMINNGGGTLTTTNLTNSTGSGGGLQQTSGLSIFKDNSNISITDANSYIRGGDVQILGNSSLYIGAGTSELTVDNLKMEGNSLLNVMNGKLNTSNIGNMEVNGTNNVSINITPREWKSDNFIVNNLTSEAGGTVHISDFDFLGYAPIDEHIKLHIFDVNSIQNVEFTTTDKEIFTPIGWYDLKSMGGGYFTSNMVRYNPQVFRGQVATLAMYNNQLAIDDMILNHVSLSSERLLAQGKNANKYAITNSQVAPYQYTKEDGGVWMKSYVNFEQLSLTRGLRVNNNSYGSIIGADFPVVNLNNGWDFIPTAYIGYNGSNQSFSNVDMYQNGAQAGFMGTFMKNDIIASILAYGGGYNNEMSLSAPYPTSSMSGYTDHTGNWFAGTAAKVSYNLHATEHFTVQPSMFLSYNAFGKQNWNTDFGIMSMNSEMMNGINVAPGVNFIYARESWNLYTAIQYMININEHVDGRAGNVDLQNVEMKHGYLQYAFGFNKTWKDRFSSYGQVTVRNAGRTGVGFQLGLQYLFDMKNTNKVKKVKHNSDKGIVHIESDNINTKQKSVIKSL